jgi:hypothetical protein
MAAMSTTTALPRRRAFRFSLRTFLLLVAGISVWLGWSLHEVHKRQEIRAYVGAQGAVVRSPVAGKPWRTMPWMWSFLGAEAVGAIELPSDKFTDDDARTIARWFPEADITVQRGGGMGMGMM